MASGVIVPVTPLSPSPVSEVTLLRAYQSSTIVLEDTVLAALLLPSTVFNGT